MFNISTILLAGGIGSRMHSSEPKHVLPLAGKPIVLHSFELFASCPSIKEIVVVCNPTLYSLFPKTSILKFATPGARRQDSVKNGFQHVSENTDLVCIHDAARPLLQKGDLERVIAEAAIHGAVALGVPLKPTVKHIAPTGFVQSTLDRDSLWEVQTPQVIQRELLSEALKHVEMANADVTDDLSMVELLGKPTKLICGSYSNLKITTPEDLAIASALLQQ